MMRGRGTSVGEASGARGAPPAASPVPALPLLEVLGEVEHPHLLELGRRVEGGTVGDPGLLGDGVEDRVALLLRAAVGHGEHRVRPVLIGWTLVAVRYAAE